MSASRTYRRGAAPRMIVLVFGTRPEAIKLGPVAAALADRKVPFRVLCSGQHTTLLRGTPAETDLVSASSLLLPSEDRPQEWMGKAVERFGLRFRQWNPSLVVVQGDTMTALAATQAAYVEGIPVAHVEAGIRSGSLTEPWPEEEARFRIDGLASIRYAATRHAVANLVVEGRESFLTGNTVVSAMQRYGGGIAPLPSTFPPTVLVTLHRRELRMDPKVRGLLRWLAAACENHPERRFLWPVHPAMRSLAIPGPNLVLTDPLDYPTMQARLRTATALITDSGGLVEEATTLGIPTAIVRNHNDRPEAEEAGIAERFDRADIALAVSWAAKALRQTPATIYGDGSAANQIALDLATRT